MPDPNPAPPSAPDPSSNLPPAAAVVAAGSLGESDAAELVRLRQEKEETARTLKARESRVAELEDENRRLKTPPPEAPEKFAFLRGGTFFESHE